MLRSPEPAALPLTGRRDFPAPLRIGVIADTHVLARGTRRLPDEILALFRRFAVGLITHAGDIATPSVLAELAGVAPLLAVAGNADDPALARQLPDRVEFTVGRFRFGLTHGHGGASARHEARSRFAGRVDCAIYGHSHVPKIEMADETILFNPGSATERRWSEHCGVGLIAVTEERIAPELVLYTDPRDLRHVTP